MEMLQLKYFLCTAKYENMSCAAQYLHTSQPSVSRAIQSLEDELNVKLFQRTGKKLILTHEGHIFYSKIYPVISQMDEISDEMKTLGKHAMSTIKVNVLSAENIFMDIVEQYSHHCHNISFKIKCRKEDTDWDLCIRNKLTDVKYNMDTQVLFHEKIHLAVHTSNALAKKTVITLDDLQKERLILMSKGFGLREIVDRAFADKNFIPNQVFECDRGYMVRSLIKRGMGSSFWPEHSWDTIEEHEPIVLKPIDLPNMNRTIYLLTPKDKELSLEVKQFRDFLIKSLKLYKK